MDRKKLMEAILNRYEKDARKASDALKETLITMPDMDMISFAIGIGIDTDKLFAQGVK